MAHNKHDPRVRRAALAWADKLAALLAAAQNLADCAETMTTWEVTGVRTMAFEQIAIVDDAVALLRSRLREHWEACTAMGKTIGKPKRRAQRPEEN